MIDRLLISQAITENSLLISTNKCYYFPVMTQTISINNLSIQTVVRLAKSGDEIVPEENGKPFAKITPIENSINDLPSNDWNKLFEAIEENQIETGTTDLAHQHDHYLYGINKRD
jgi:antitoxin (DNA-binding transcriptional repressor) of toxin-antitoxin stability system